MPSGLGLCRVLQRRRRPAQAIMILRAGGEPGRGEIPMIQISSQALEELPI